MFGKYENFDHLYAAFNASSMDEGKKLDFIGEYIEILKKVQNEALIKKLVDKIGFMIPKALGKTNTIQEMDKIADRVLPYIPADMIEGFYGYYGQFNLGLRLGFSQDFAMSIKPETELMIGGGIHINLGLKIGFEF